MRVQKLVAALCCALAASLLTPAARAQAAGDTATLTLEEAVKLALRNNPEYQQVVDQRSPAAARVRSAYGAFVPNAGVNFSTGYRAAGDQTVNGFSGFTAGSDVIQSSYGVNLSYDLAVATFVNPSLESANLKATDEEILSAAALLRSAVTDRYLLVLVDEANARIQDSLITSNQVQVDLAQARLNAGSGTLLDLAKAKVGLGQQRIVAIRANNQAQVDAYQLYQQLGVPKPRNVKLTTRIGVAAPGFTLDSVLKLAHQTNPALLALIQRNSAAEKGVTATKGEFLPTLHVNAGWGGYGNEYTNSNYPVSAATASYNQAIADCSQTDSLRQGVGMTGINCSAYIPPPDTAAIKSANSAFKYTKSPFQANAVLSLPIYDGLSRLTRVEQAKAFSNDAMYKVRSQELRLDADVTSAYLTLIAQNQAVDLARDNVEQAKLQLTLAQEKYRVGSATALELTDARDSYQRAEEDLLSAIFEFHRSFAALERAVGRPLR